MGVPPVDCGSLDIVAPYIEALKVRSGIIIVCARGDIDTRLGFLSRSIDQLSSIL
jgi:hypothetical protein